ncbi:MAG: hypothetical protein ACJAZC_000366 [Cryomorphaceae bacterium]
MFKIVICTILIGLSPNLWGQAYIVDPDFANDLGNRYYSRVMGIEYEPQTDTYMLAGTFAGGEPFTPCLNRINDLGEDDFLWNPENPESCSGVLNNFFRVPNGYRFGANMIKRNDEGVLNTSTVPDFTGTEQIAASAPRGWADSNGAIYVASNWRLLEEEGQPETGLIVFTPQGERFEPFPIIRVGHPEFTATIADIYEYDDDRLMLGGSFDSLNGHLSIRMARMFKNGTIDTSFSSNLERHRRAVTLNVDAQGRVLVNHMEGGSEETPNDDLEIWRLLPDGSIDPSWNIIDLALSGENTGGNSARTAVYNEENGSYFIYGRFNLVNGVPRTSICQVDSQGNLLDTFDDEPFRTDLEAHPQLISFGDVPELFDIEKTLDGGLLIGGRFTHYQDQPYLNLIKLIPDPLSTADRDFPVQMKIYPNPATDRVTIQVGTSALRLRSATPPLSGRIESIRITDLSGRAVASYPWNGDNASYDVSDLASGLYLLQVIGQEGILGMERLVID